MKHSAETLLLCIVVVGCQCFRRPCCPQNIGILPHYAASQCRRPQLESSPPWRSQILHKKCSWWQCNTHSIDL